MIFRNSFNVEGSDFFTSFFFAQSVVLLRIFSIIFVELLPVMDGYIQVSYSHSQ